jgi:nitroimidazol reductase NimA-like FMN-containing flavoprotein (pyridoxamine 5'-phosphate oxidase superfamily)
MVILELSGAECDEVLARTAIGRLGCARDNQPYIVPILYSFDQPGRCLYSFATAGQKIDWMRSNPRVCLEVDEIEDEFRWSSVLVAGRYDELAASSAGGGARERALELLQQRQEWWMPGAARVGSSDQHFSPVVFRIKIDQVSGRRAARRSS